MSKKKIRHLTGYTLKYSDNLKEDMLYWADGASGVQYAVIDSFYRSKGAFNCLPRHFKDRLVKIRLTIEEL